MDSVKDASSAASQTATQGENTSTISQATARELLLQKLMESAASYRHMPGPFGSLVATSSVDGEDVKCEGAIGIQQDAKCSAARTKPSSRFEKMISVVDRDLSIHIIQTLVKAGLKADYTR
ncbi:MAG: hypothetical protein AAFP93_00965 [Bacteroidota bacterium]